MPFAPWDIQNTQAQALVRLDEIVVTVFPSGSRSTTREGFGKRKGFASLPSIE